MKVSISITVFSIFCMTVFMFNNAVGEDKSISQEKVGIQISQDNFDRLVYQYTNFLEKKDSLKSVNDCIAVVRLFNTIYYSDLNKVERYKRFIHSLNQYYSNLIIAILDAKEQKGLYYYSKKYDISYGGPSANNSMFRIVDK